MTASSDQLDVTATPELGFRYGPGTVGPEPEFRSLDRIRPSLLDPHCTGPDPVYGIAMDVARADDLPQLQKRMLLFGIVAYAAGQLGEEPVRSQGHVHAIAPHSGWSPPELFEIIEGRAIVFAQQRAEDDPGRCIAVTAGPGDKVVVPPGWAHCVINADPLRPMVFGAWCDRQYGFDYTGVRAHHGLAWFPILGPAGTIRWQPNLHYRPSKMEVHPARTYPELAIDSTRTLYQHFLADPETVMWVPEPGRHATLWHTFLP